MKPNPDIAIITDIFSKEEIDVLYEIIQANEPVIDVGLGRIRYCLLTKTVKPEIFEKFKNIIKEVSDLPLEISSFTYVEYSALHGDPKLPPHLDRDTNDLLINIQMESNTDWAIGLGLDVYPSKDNAGLIFNPNKEIHWRTHKEFKDGEYVRMLFVRFVNPSSPSDYSYLPKDPDDSVFNNIVAFRDSYPQPDKPKMS
jgi:hypothetical protein